MLWTWLRRLFGPAPRPHPRMRDVLERLDVLETDVGGLRKKLVRIQGWVTGAMRHAEQESEPQLPLGPTIGEAPTVQVPPNRFRRLAGWR